MANAPTHHHFSLVFSSILLIAPLVADAVQHTVGRSAGWTIPAVGNVNYSTWAADFSFSVGDALVFKYDATLHNVLQVSEGEYDNCSVSTPEASYDNGTTVVTLDTAGMWYFICGVPGHCLAGQKLEVHVDFVSPSLAPSPQTQAPSFVPLPSPPSISPSPSPLIPSPSPLLMSPSLAPSQPSYRPPSTTPSTPRPASNAPPFPSKTTLLVALLVALLLGPWNAYAHFL